MHIIRPSYLYFVIQTLFHSLFFSAISMIISFFLKQYVIFPFYLYVFIISPYFFTIFIYRPLKFKNTLYKIKKSSIQIESGVLFRYKLYVPYYAIKYMSNKCNILQKFFGVQTLTLYTVSGHNSIKNINFPLASVIRHKIWSAKEEK